MSTPWVENDDALVAYLRQEMGESSDYGTLTIADADIFASAIRRIEDWRHLTMPTVMVIGRRMLRDGGEFGDGLVHYDKHYPYIILCMVDGDKETSWRDAKILENRVVNALKKQFENTAQILYPETGESVNLINVGDSQVSIYRKPTNNPGNNEWWAVSAIELMIESTD